MQFTSVSRNLAEPLPAPTISTFNRRASLPIMGKKPNILVEPEQKKHYSVTFTEKTASQGMTRTRSDDGAAAAQQLQRTRRFRASSRAGSVWPPRSKSCDLAKPSTPSLGFFGGSMQPETQPLEALDRESTHAVGINYLRGKSKRLFASPAKKSTKILAPVSPLLDKLFHKRPGRNLEDDEGKMDVLRPEAPSKKKTLEAFTRRSSVDGLPPLRKPSPTSGAGIRRCSSSPMSCNDDVREDIKKAFEDADLDHNGTIDKFELGKLLMGLAPLQHPIDDLDAIFDEVDTDRNGVIDPMEFRLFLEQTINAAEARCIRLNIAEVVSSAFRESLTRVRHERNCVCRAFLAASQAQKSTRFSGFSSWIFTLYDRLHAHPVDSNTLPGKESGRLAYLKEILNEVMTLAEIILTPGNDERMVRGAEGKIGRISELVFGENAGKQGELSVTAVISFCQDWLAEITRIEFEEGIDGETGVGSAALEELKNFRAMQSGRLEAKPSGSGGGGGGVGSSPMRENQTRRSSNSPLRDVQA